MNCVNEIFLIDEKIHLQTNTSQTNTWNALNIYLLNSLAVFGPSRAEVCQNAQLTKHLQKKSNGAHACRNIVYRFLAMMDLSSVCDDAFGHILVLALGSACSVIKNDMNGIVRIACWFQFHAKWLHLKLKELYTVQ